MTKNDTKFQIEMIKSLEKAPGQQQCYAEDKDYIYATYNGYWVVKIAKNDFFISLDKLNHQPNLINIFKDDNLKDTEQLVITNKMQKMGKSMIVTLQGKTFETQVNETYLKTTIMHKYGALYAKDEKSPIYFAVDKIIYSVAMPVIKK